MNPMPALTDNAGAMPATPSACTEAGSGVTRRARRDGTVLEHWLDSRPRRMTKHGAIHRAARHAACHAVGRGGLG